MSGQDVLAVVEELWLAGAEGVAVNGERVTVATAIVDIGGSVLVNSAYVAPPYQVVGDRARRHVRPADELAGLRRLHPRPGPRRSASASTTRRRDAVDLPAYAGSVNLRYGRADRDARAGARPAAP